MGSTESNTDGLELWMNKRTAVKVEKLFGRWEKGERGEREGNENDYTHGTVVVHDLAPDRDGCSGRSAQDSSVAS